MAISNFGDAIRVFFDILVIVIISLIIGALLYTFVGYIFGIGPLVQVKTVETCQRCAGLEMGAVRNGDRYDAVGGATGMSGLPRYSFCT